MTVAVVVSGRPAPAPPPLLIWPSCVLLAGNGGAHRSMCREDLLPHPGEALHTHTLTASLFKIHILVQYRKKIVMNLTCYFSTYSVVSHHLQCLSVAWESCISLVIPCLDSLRFPSSQSLASPCLVQP